MKRNTLIYILIIAAIGIFYFARYKVAPTLNFEDITLKDESGKMVQLSGILDDKSVVHFYASWCGPCLHEMKVIKQNFTALSNENIRFIFITDDQPDNLDRMMEYMPAEINFYTIPSLKEAGIRTLPTTYFMNRNEIVEKQVDVFDWSNITTLNKIFSH